MLPGIYVLVEELDLLGHEVGFALLRHLLHYNGPDSLVVADDGIGFDERNQLIKLPVVLDHLYKSVHRHLSPSFVDVPSDDVGSNLG